MNIYKLLDQLKASEGFREDPYRDSRGFWTIAHGYLIDERKGAGISNGTLSYLSSRNWASLHNGTIRITKDGGHYLLDRYVSRMLSELVEHLPWWEKLDDVRQRVIAEMAYQMGVPTLLTFVATLGHMRRGEVEQAAEQMLESAWARQTPARAKRLSVAYRTGSDAA